MLLRNSNVIFFSFFFMVIQALFNAVGPAVKIGIGVLGGLIPGKGGTSSDQCGKYA